MPGGFDDGRGGNGFLDALAGDEPAGKAVAAPHPVRGCEPFQRVAGGESVEESLGYAVDHQWVRVGRRGPSSRCSSVRA